MNLNDFNTDQQKILTQLKDEKKELAKSRTFALFITAPILIYTGLGKNPPKILKAVVVATGITMLLNNLTQLTKNKK